ncbi:MAG: tetratricopeptide repeat protein [Verrucomicrobiota bacterium]|jgi:tetratricopeptide (TPR) repeat protein
MKRQIMQKWQAPAVCLFLAAITFAVFGQTLGHEFVNFDDNVYVYENPVVAGGLTFKGIVWAFSFHAANWHPLTWISHMLDCQLYGLHPAGHHLTNVILHTATVIALFLVLRQMTGALWRSAFVAAVFAIHPLRVESVAWVAERKDVLSGLFFMLTIGAYVRHARNPLSAARYALVILLFALGLMCKPMLVTLPLVLLLLDYWPLQRKEPAGRLVLEKWPLLALSAASCAATLLAQREAMPLTGAVSVPSLLVTALLACKVYLCQMVCPAGLAVFYPFPHQGLPVREAAMAGTLLAVISAAVVWQWRKRPWLLVGWVWYVVMLLPVLGIIQVGQQAHADRYTYLPQIGIYIAITWLATEWRISRAALGGLMAGVIGLFMFCAWQQAAYWQNSETLWADALACTLDNDLAQDNLGLVLLQKGRIDAAINCFQEALRIRPDFAEARNNLGNALLQTGKVEEAIACFRQALQLRPDFAQAEDNLGYALLQTATVDEAIAHCQRALQIKPDDAEACVNLGNAFVRKGEAQDAIALYRKALQIKPGLAVAQRNLDALLRQRPAGQHLP